MRDSPVRLEQTELQEAFLSPSKVEHCDRASLRQVLPNPTTDRRTLTRASIHVHTNTHTYTHTYTHKQANTHAYRHARSHTYIHTHSHATITVLQRLLYPFTYRHFPKRQLLEPKLYNSVGYHNNTMPPHGDF